jgi:hypothetical protein
MNQRIQTKLEQYKKMAGSQSGNATTHTTGNRTDSLAQVIRSKKDADQFMAELESAAKRAK